MFKCLQPNRNPLSDVNVVVVDGIMKAIARALHTNEMPNPYLTSIVLTIPSSPIA
jgi:hypothetical protein